MKKLTVLLAGFLLSIPLYAQEKQSYEIDFKDPSSVVNALFYAAQTNDLSLLAGLCDPLKENDGDTKRICALASLSRATATKTSKEDLKAFINTFKYGKINGAIELLRKGDQEGAKVPIAFSYPDKGTAVETVVLIKRYGNFYLASM